MGASYGVHFSDTEARGVVDAWRAANPWAMQFGNDLWAALLEAKDNPGEFVAVGRIGFIFIADLLGGSMLMRLPSGRFLTYRRMHWDMVPVKDEDDNVIGHQREMTYGRGHGRSKLWKGELGRLRGSDHPRAYDRKPPVGGAVHRRSRAHYGRPLCPAGIGD